MANGMYCDWWVTYYDGVVGSTIYPSQGACGGNGGGGGSKAVCSATMAVRRTTSSRSSQVHFASSSSALGCYIAAAMASSLS
jgi:hypothetical protein